ncbi:MAG: DUF2378 family protein [Archangium sp.]
MSSSLVHPSLRDAPLTLPVAERVNFASVFEGLFNTAFKNQVTPELRDELRAMGLDLTLLNAAYPHEIFLKAVAAGAKAWFPGEPPEESWFKVGQRNLEGFYETFLGKPLFALLRVMGPKRTLGRMKANFRSANNYTDSKLVEVGPGELQLWINEMGNTRHFVRGVMFRGLQLAGSPNVKFDELSTDERGTVYRVLI